MSLQLPHDLPYLARSCTTHDGRPKKRYPSRRAAEHDARLIEEAQCRAMHAYLCPGCRSWHVGFERWWDEAEG